MKVALVLHGDSPSVGDIALLDRCDKVVCADGAAKALLKLGRPPSVIVGDMDSLDTETQRWADAVDVELERHPARKDFTDGELALARALAFEPDRLVLFGLHGGRTGHFLSNLKLLRRAHDAGIDAVGVGHGETLRFLGPGEEMGLSAAKGHGLCLVPVDGDAVVSTRGTAYDGDRLRLDSLSARGISNTVKDPAGKVTVHEGTVLAILESP